MADITPDSEPTDRSLSVRHSKFEKMLVESHRELADRHIRDLSEKIAAAERGEYDGNVAVMRDLLDKWLEHRHAHGDDERLPL
jgi:hypothetical protein